MKTPSITNTSPKASLPKGKKTGPTHEHHDGKCSDVTCETAAAHNHWTDYGCLGCIKDYLKTLLPFEEKIKNLEVGNTAKQLLLMTSNLTPAVVIAEILKPFHITPFIASPVAISAMHLTNRGTNQLSKLLFTSLSSLGITALQKFINLPRILIRPIMALAVFFIERTGKSQINESNHVHTEECKHPEHDEEPEHNHNLDSTKNAWIKLLKLQGQINTVPWIVNFFTNKLKEKNADNSMFVKFFNHIGITALQIGALSLGFTGLGHVIDKALLKFNLISGEESEAMRAEGAVVCSCGCGAPVCVAETASEVGSLVAV